MNSLETNTAKEFALKNVITISFYWFPFIGFILSVPVFYLYGEFGFRYFGVLGLVFTAFILFIFLYLILKYLSKNITISFLDNTINFDCNGRIQKLNKKDIVGIFSHDYQNSRTSLISFQIWFKNGEKLEITDSKFSEKYDVDSNQNLKRFLGYFTEYLGFTKIRKSRLRAFKKLGACWYANPDISLDKNAER